MATTSLNQNNKSKLNDYSSNSTASDKLILYGDEAAPPVRFVLMTACALGVNLDFRSINLFANENRTEAYKKINPLQKVPSMVIDNQNICDSHVISLYLCRKWDTKHTLYPQDDLTKAKVDEILFFNSSTLFPIDSEIFSKFFAGSSASENRIEDWYKALDFLDNRLHSQPWLAGDKMMICDICALSTITSMLCLMPLAERHVGLKKWLKAFENQPFFNINKKGLERLQKYVMIAKNGSSNNY
ncbi:glutathione S-transferase E14-like [Battus philenor]|uniref:glutathione S-transferase E14-like n=1 Tax=Battus philenor TaxID=42288 RepID=UPI0035CEA320